MPDSLFAKAQSQGLQIARMPPQEREATNAEPRERLDIVGLVGGIKEAIQETSSRREKQAEELIEQLKQLDRSFSERDRASQQAEAEVLVRLSHVADELGRTQAATIESSDRMVQLGEKLSVLMDDLKPTTRARSSRR
jgi:hypothetical protein